MYIPYFEIAKKISSVLPERFKKPVEDFGCKLKIKQNLAYISKNQIKVKQKLKKKQVLNVAFYVYDDTKWKCQSVYDLMIADERFTPCIIATKNAAENPDNPSYQTKEDVIKTYNFFKTRNMNVKYGYDIDNERFIPLKEFSPDIIIYQHPWYVETSQGPVVCSEFALTCYVPYYFPTTSAPIDYYLRFHQYVERYYIFDEITRQVYVKKMQNHGKNLKVTGQPFLDYFRFNKNQDKDYIIYAPHWTICRQGIAYGTFEWNGQFLLDFAKQHPEQKWIFKPHPMLFKTLIDNNVMSKDEVESYYNEWDNIGIKYESGDYLELFSKSKMLITDCSSFLGEYFMTENPVIHLISKEATPYNETINQIIKYYYRVENLSELTRLLETLPTQDSMQTLRIEALQQLGYKDNYAAKNILDDILEQVGRS